MRLLAAFAAVLVLAGAACGRDDGGATADAAATTPETQTLTVQVTAEIAGIGCTLPTGRAGFAGTSSRLTVTDDAGTVVGTGTFELSPNADSCDWTTTIDDIPADADFYRLEHAGGELATLSADELGPGLWSVDLHIDVLGDVTVGSGT